MNGVSKCGPKMHIKSFNWTLLASLSFKWSKCVRSSNSSFEDIIQGFFLVLFVQSSIFGHIMNNHDRDWKPKPLLIGSTEGKREKWEENNIVETTKIVRNSNTIWIEDDLNFCFWNGSIIWISAIWIPTRACLSNVIPKFLRLAATAQEVTQSLTTRFLKSVYSLPSLNVTRFKKHLLSLLQ